MLGQCKAICNSTKPNPIQQIDCLGEVFRSPSMYRIHARQRNGNLCCR